MFFVLRPSFFVLTGRKLAFRDIIGLDALSQLRSRPFIVFIISVMLTSIPLATYFAYVPVS